MLLPPSLLADSSQSGAERPKIGLALSGGGARGSAHIGVLKALEELGIKVDYIAGTSMGAIIGGMYASGYSAAEIEEILISMDWESALLDRAKRVDRTMRTKELEGQFLIPYRLGFNGGRFQLPLGLIEGQHLDQVLREILLPVVTIHDFSELPIPFTAVATDLVTGEEVRLSEGSLPDSIRASMSVPGVFAPVSLEDRLLIDGGMSNNLPVSVARDMGADVVIAVDISSMLLEREQFKSVFSVTEQLTNFLTRRTTDAQIETLSDGDLLIVPDLEGFSSANFADSGGIISTGYEAAMVEKANLSALSTGHQGHPVRWDEQIKAPYIVSFVELENGSVLHDEIIRSRLAAEPGQPLDLKALDTSVDQIYSLDVFQSVTYDILENEEGETGVVVESGQVVHAVAAS
jgi:NTE family protein